MVGKFLFFSEADCSPRKSLYLRDEGGSCKLEARGKLILKQNCFHSLVNYFLNEKIHF